MLLWSIFMAVPCNFDDCSFVIEFEIRKCVPPALFFFKIAFAIHHLRWFHTNIRIAFFISVKNSIWILRWIYRWLWVVWTYLFPPEGQIFISHWKLVHGLKCLCWYEQPFHPPFYRFTWLFNKFNSQIFIQYIYEIYAECIYTIHICKYVPDRGERYSCEQDRHVPCLGARDLVDPNSVSGN